MWETTAAHVGFCEGVRAQVTLRGCSSVDSKTGDSNAGIEYRGASVLKTFGRFNEAYD